MSNLAKRQTQILLFIDSFLWKSESGSDVGASDSLEGKDVVDVAFWDVVRIIQFVVNETLHV